MNINRIVLKKKVGVGLMILLFLFSCNKKREYSKEEFVKYLQDTKNGLINNKTVNNIINMKVSYRPNQLVFSKMSSQKDTNELLPDSNKVPYCYFILSISRNGNELLADAFSTPEEYSNILNKLAFYMNDYVFITTSNKDTIYVEDYTMLRTYGAAQSTDMQFAFKSEKILGADWMDVNVQDIGLEINTQKFRFEINDLRKANEIIISKH